MPHTATRQIGIDMGHRVTNHGSKCKNIHGHRYTIEATIGGALVPSGASEGMVADFGFMKDAMMQEIDGPCDHGLCLWIKDPLVPLLLKNPAEFDALSKALEDGILGQCAQGVCGKLYLMDLVPTAENLAEHWFRRLGPAIDALSNGQAHIVNVKVWETPNCFAEYFA